MPLVLVRRPRSATRMASDIQEEVRVTLESLGEQIKERLKTDVEDWEEQPEFTAKVTIESRTWMIEVKVNKDQAIGQIYEYVDKGTSVRGGFSDAPYIITPLKPDGKLVFSVPHSPKTLPNPSVPDFPSTEEPHTVITPFVFHPGIYPRNFTKTLIDELRDRTKPGGFRSVIEAAIKRALRKR